MTMPLDEKGLEACPFCGGAAEACDGMAFRGEPDLVGNPFVHCLECTTVVSGNSRDEAIAAWNRRALSTAKVDDGLSALIAEMRAGLEGVTPGPWQVIKAMHPWRLEADAQWGRPEAKAGAHEEFRIATTWHDGQMKGPYPVVTLAVGIGAEPRQPIHMVQMNREVAEHIARCSPDNIRRLLDAAEAGATAKGVVKAEPAAIPTQRQMNEVFYVDVYRAEDRLKEFVAAGRKLLSSLPPHWHDDNVVELGDLCAETDAVLNPHMHKPYQVEQAAKRYGASSIAPTPASPPPGMGEVVEALRPFAAYAALSGFEKLPDDFSVTSGSRIAARQLTAADFRRARAALSRIGGPNDA